MSHKAFAEAYSKSKPELLRIPQLQEFAAAIWQRRSAIPSQSYSDPLLHLFDEYDTDGDNTLQSGEIASAFQSNGVEVTADQVQVLIDAYEEGRGNVISREEWPEFVHSLAVSDLHIRDHIRPPPSSDSGSPSSPNGGR